MDDVPRTRFYRLLEMIPGMASWLILTVPFIAAYWLPRAVAIFITVYVMLWFTRTLKSSIFLLIAYLKSRKYEKVDWNHLLKFFSAKPSEPHTQIEQKTAAQITKLKSLNLFKETEDIRHIVIIPTYKEEKDILESSIKAISESNYPLDKIILVLATEERDRERANANAEYLLERFKNTFGYFFHVMHPANLPGEIPAKGANITYASKFMAEFLKKNGIDFSNALVTTLDADNRPHPYFFSNLTYHYLMEEFRAKRAFQPLAYFYNNIWDVPFTNRLIALANTFWFLSESGESYHLFNASVYAQGMDALYAMDFWSRQTIIEDLHQFWRAYFHFNGDYEVIPLFIPVYQDALQNKTYFTSLVGQYKQLKRWASASSEIPYIFIKILRGAHDLPIFKSIYLFAHLIYLQIMWATGPIIILLNESILNVVNKDFSNSIFAYNISQALKLILTLMLIGIAASLLVSLLSLPSPKGRFPKWHIAVSILQWIMLPFVTIIYGAIPAIDAQTQIMLGRKIGFTVTEKIRKIT